MKVVGRLLRHFTCLVGYGALGAIVAIVALYVGRLQGLPDLKPWHTAELDAEFRAEDAGTVLTLEDYLRREDAVFQQLVEQVYQQVPATERRQASRYSAGSLADPLPVIPDWNRTVELPLDGARGGALLLHGLSDSPYSTRAVAEVLRDRGYWVLALRLPGHGTAPTGLVAATWEDFAAAVRIGARHLQNRVGPDRPLVLVGYSNGAALAVEYALSRLQGEALPEPAGLVLLSPAIGVTPVAALAVWQARLSVLLGQDKVAWTDISPEYDPYKYVSFPVNAGHQAHRLTTRIRAEIEALAGPDGVTGMPPVLAFQSVADATVSTKAVVETLMARLAPEGHELVLFDLDRHQESEALFLPDALTVQGDLFRGPRLPFDLTALVNAGPREATVVALRRAALADEVRREPTGLAWPRGVFSLSHVAVPFRRDDPVYGDHRPLRPTQIYLGRVDLLGERGVLAVPPSALLRLRHNPFFRYLEDRLDEFLDTLEAPAPLGAVTP